MNRNRIVRMPWHNPDRPAYAARLDDDLGTVLAGETEPLGHCRAHDEGVLPRDLCERFRQFLLPAVVGESAISDGRICLDDQLCSLDRICGKEPYRVGIEGQRERFVSSLGNNPVVEGPAESLLESLGWRLAVSGWGGIGALLAGKAFRFVSAVENLVPVGLAAK